MTQLVNFFDLITFNRPTNATRVNSLGLIENVPANRPRADYDPVTGALRGLLIEEARTNLVLGSQFDSAAPSHWGTTGFGHSEELVTMRNGLPGLRFQANSERPIYTQSLTLQANTPYTMSAYIENFDDNLGRVILITGLTDASGDISADVLQAGNDGLLQFTFTTGADTSGGLRIGPGVATTATGGLVMGGVQLEQGSFTTSYIPTTGAAATRAADNASFAIGDWFNASEGTFYAEIELAAGWLNVGNNRIIGTNASGAKGFLTTAGSERVSMWNGTNSTNRGGLAPLAGRTTRLVSAYSLGGNNIAVTADGLPPAEVNGSAGDFSGVSEIFLGRSPYLNGHIKDVRYFPRRLSNAELQELTQ